MSRVKPESEGDDAARREAERYFAPTHRKRLLRNVELASRGGCFLNGGARSVKVQGIPAAAINLLNMKRSHVHLIHNCFHSIDEDRSGAVCVSEMLHHFKFNDTPFLRRAIRECCFAAGDVDEDGEISESEFYLMCSILCTDSRDQVMFRWFTMCDTDKSGFIVSYS